MGLIPTDLDDAFEAVEMSAPLADGEHTGTIVSAEVRPSKAPWRDAELSVCLQSDTGGRAYADIEVAPLTGKDGMRSAGKLKFLKWQLQAMGYGNQLSELEFNVDKLIGNRIKFKVTSTESQNINEKTGRPYINRDVVALELVENVNTAPEPAVY